MGPARVCIPTAPALLAGHGTHDQHLLFWTTVRKMVALCCASFSLGFLTWQVYFPASLNSTSFRTMEMLLSFPVVEPTNSTRGLRATRMGSEALLFILPW